MHFFNNSVALFLNTIFRIDGVNFLSELWDSGSHIRGKLSYAFYFDFFVCFGSCESVMSFTVMTLVMIQKQLRCNNQI